MGIRCSSRNSPAAAERSTRDATQLPGSIRGIVAARLDALPPPEREVLLDASVVGKVFWRGALERLRLDREDLPGLLGSLERRDLIRREASSRIKGDQQFTFKHGLIREVAYLTLPREERRRCHETTASYLEDVGLRAGDADATLAYHWREAGDGAKALRYLLAAADAAGRGWAKGPRVDVVRAGARTGAGGARRHAAGNHPGSARSRRHPCCTGPNSRPPVRGRARAPRASSRRRPVGSRRA